MQESCEKQSMCEKMVSILQGKGQTLSVGKIMLNYYCSACEDIRTFTSEGKLSCVFVNKQVVSIDCVLACGCGASVQAWFLVECDEDICGQAPGAFVKRSEKLSSVVKINNERYGDYSGLLEKAERAFREDLGAGMDQVYLRKAFEKITVQTAKAIGIDYDRHEGGNPKNFRNLLEEVDRKSSIIPREFSKNGYSFFEN